MTLNLHLIARSLFSATAQCRRLEPCNGVAGQMLHIESMPHQPNTLSLLQTQPTCISVRRSPKIISKFGGSYGGREQDGPGKVFCLTRLKFVFPNISILWTSRRRFRSTLPCYVIQRFDSLDMPLNMASRLRTAVAAYVLLFTLCINANIATRDVLTDLSGGFCRSYKFGRKLPRILALQCNF